ncbi:hypothetical protein QIS74_01684 [Colletotrichum tabaci]|uniref:Zn(2)-C6 fungal-type domain-containing protein n=1 Tax=Colletotrichum tabaci TaxID=1209068 RepID=A0AAV9TSQ4_9PEZI
MQPQKRKSCEACRSRKLKCSGKDSTGCSRCVRLGLVCDFHDKGMPGRPRKWSIVELGEEQQQQQQHRRRRSTHARHAKHNERQIRSFGGQQDEAQDRDTRVNDRTTTPLFSPDEGSSIAATSSGDSVDTVFSDAIFSSGDDFGALPFLDFDMSGQLDALPLDSFRSCLIGVEHDMELPSPSSAITTTTAAAASTSTSTLASVSVLEPAAATAVGLEPSCDCDCAKQVFDVIRSLNTHAVSHNTVRTLRQGGDLFDTLLTCPKCYDVSRPPRVTLQNVLLIGRLCLKVTAGYQRYLRWLRDYCSGLAEGNMCGDTVYLALGGDGGGEPGGGDAGSGSGSGSSSGSPLLLGFQTTSNGFFDVVTQGLKSDAERLARLGGRFAERQRQRHLIGHMACPDQDGRCWKERDCYADPDPSDVCPQSAAARTLIPCYRIVDEVRAKIRQFEDALA